MLHHTCVAQQRNGSQGISRTTWTTQSPQRPGVMIHEGYSKASITSKTKSPRYIGTPTNIERQQQEFNACNKPGQYKSTHPSSMHSRQRQSGTMTPYRQYTIKL